MLRSIGKQCGESVEWVIMAVQEWTKRKKGVYTQIDSTDGSVI